MTYLENRENQVEKNSQHDGNAGKTPFSGVLQAKIEDANRRLFAVSVLQDPQSSLEKFEEAVYGIARSIQQPADSARNIAEFIALSDPGFADYAEKMKAAVCAILDLSLRHMQRNEDISNREKFDIVLAAVRPLKKNIGKIKRALRDYERYDFLLGLIEHSSLDKKSLKEVYDTYLLMDDFNRQITDELKIKSGFVSVKPETFVGRLLERNGEQKGPISMDKYGAYAFKKTR